MASWTVLSRRLRLTLLHGCGVSGVAAACCRTATVLWEMLMLCEVPCVSGRRVGDGCAVWSGTRAWQGGGRGGGGVPGGGGLRFAFYGRVSTEDWQDPVTSRARQRHQADVLVAGHGKIVAGFFDSGQSRTLPWARRPQAAALVAALADPDRGWDEIVIGEYERAFYGSQYAAMAPLFEH